MKVLIIGAAGNIGSRILREAVSRGHEVTAVSRREGAIDPGPSVEVERADARDAGEVARIVDGHDAVVVTVSYRKEGDAPIHQVVRAVVEGTRGAGPRVFVVGGAGSLEISPGVQLLDTPEFPEAYRAESLQAREALGVVRASEADWTYLSPAAEISPGERTGRYRAGGDRLLTDEEGNSRISTEDFAVAVIDELEEPKHRGQRFTVAY